MYGRKYGCMDGNLPSLLIYEMSNTSFLCSVLDWGSMMPLLFPLLLLPKWWKLTIQMTVLLSKASPSGSDPQLCSINETFSPLDSGTPHYLGSSPKLLATFSLASLHSLPPPKSYGPILVRLLTPFKLGGNAVIIAMNFFGDVFRVNT